MKKFLSFGLLLALLIGLFALPAGASEKNNVKTYDHPLYVRDSGTFRPDESMTRGEMADILYELTDNHPGSFIGYDAFSDVPLSSDNISVIGLSLMGVLKGYPDGTFRPDKPVTRAEFVVLLARVVELAQGERTFPDVSADDWAYDTISSAGAAGWIDGYPDGTFRPEQFVTRAEAVKLVNHVLDRHCDKAFVDREEHLEPFLFSDVPADHWAYYEMMEASISHDCAIENGSEVWTAAGLGG